MSDQRKGMSLYPRGEEELVLLMHLIIRVGEKERERENFLITKCESCAQPKIQT